MFNNLSDRLNDTFDRLRGKGKLTEADITSAMRDIRMALLEADVNFKVVKDFVAKTKERCMTADVLESLTPAQNVVKIVLDELVELLGSTESKLVLSSRIPNVIMLVGLQGSGKTTAAVKLAYMLKKQGRSPLLAACDVYRPAAADQLATLGGEIGVPVFRGDGAHPVEIAQGAIKEAVDHLRDVVIVDTAGRLQIDEQMMQEAVDIKRAVKPDQVLMVVDAMTGQDIVNVVSTFAERTDFDGVIISKLDGDARGGGALSVRAVTGKPIKFVSMGEKPESLEVFSPDRMAKRILGMGDVVGIIEKAQEVADAEQMEAAERMLREGLTMDDMLEQMRAVRKMGGMKGILGMLPGGQRALNQMGGNVDESILDKNEAMIQSMTQAERLKPQVHQRPAPRPHRPWLGHHAHRREQPAQAVGRDEQDDGQDALRWPSRPAPRRAKRARRARRCACPVCPAWPTSARSWAAETRSPVWAAWVVRARATWTCCAPWSSR